MESSPLRVLHVSPYYFPAHAYGGPVQSVHRLCMSLAEMGATLRVLTTNAHGTNRTLAVDTQLEVRLCDGLTAQYCHRVGTHSVSPQFLALLPARVMWADVVHITAVYSFTTLPALLACRALQKPVVWSPRGALQRWSGSTRTRLKAFWEHLAGLAAPRRIRLHVTSPQEGHASTARLSWSQAVVIPNGVDIAPPAADSRSGVLRMLFLGRLHPIKGLENLVQACAELDRTGFRQWTLTIAGPGDADYIHQLMTQASTAGVSDRVRFTGLVEGEAKDALFSACDVLVLPSHIENFGIVVAEALAHAVPVIASRGTPWQGVEDNGCGLWTDNSPRALAAAVRCMADQPLHDMGLRGHAWMERDFGWHSVATRMLDLYRHLVTSERPSAPPVTQ